jgi:dTDP-glucose 4,6-dehydratase
MRKPINVLVTGGAGFIGSNFIRYLFEYTPFMGRVVNLDKLTYSGNLLNLQDIETVYGRERYIFERGDIAEAEIVRRIFRDYEIDTVVHFAAESHVDRSIRSPREFIYTNVVGTFNLLEAARRQWYGRKDVLFHQVSTDEVYGSLSEAGTFCETSPYDPRSPYSASKAAADHLVRSYYHTYGLPVTLSNCSNNYGPYQFPEKLIPLMINNMRSGRPLPVYGNGRNVRDWLYVTDHAEAIWCIVQFGKPGSTYNVGGENEWENIELLHLLCERMAAVTGTPCDHYKKLITFVKDRPGHDRRYALNCDKIKKEFGWSQRVSFEHGLDLTIRWYLANQEWMNVAASGSYYDWYKQTYINRQ